jgi:hypothetical protein
MMNQPVGTSAGMYKETMLFTPLSGPVRVVAAIRARKSAAIVVRPNAFNHFGNSPEREPMRSVAATFGIHTTPRMYAEATGMMCKARTIALDTCPYSRADHRNRPDACQ